MADLATGVGALGCECTENWRPVGGPGFFAFEVGLLHKYWNSGGQGVDHGNGFHASCNSSINPVID